MIAIKLADGSYYPVLDELQQQAKRLVLVPATSDQKAIHIIFYQDNNIDFSQPQLIGKMELLNLPLTSDTEQNQNVYITIDPRMDNVLKIHSTQGNQGAEQDFSFSFTVAENTAPASPPPTEDEVFPVQLSSSEVEAEMPEAEVPGAELSGAEVLRDEVLRDVALEGAALGDVALEDEVAEDSGESDETPPGEISLPDEASPSDEISLSDEAAPSDEISLSDEAAPSDETFLDETFLSDETTPPDEPSLPDETYAEADTGFEGFPDAEADGDDLYQQTESRESWEQENSLSDDTFETEEEERKPLSIGIIAILSALGVVVVIALSFLFFRISQGNPTPIMQSSQNIKTILSLLLK